MDHILVFHRALNVCSDIQVDRRRQVSSANSRSIPDQSHGGYSQDYISKLNIKLLDLGGFLWQLCSLCLWSFYLHFFTICGCEDLKMALSIWLSYCQYNGTQRNGNFPQEMHAIRRKVHSWKRLQTTPTTCETTLQNGTEAWTMMVQS